MMLQPVLQEDDACGTHEDLNGSSTVLVRNAIVGYVQTAANVVTGLCVTPLLLRGLGSDLFGVWALLLGVSGYFALLESVLHTSVTRRVAEALALRDRERLERALGSALAVSCGLAAAVVVLFGAAALMVDRLGAMTPDHDATARFVLACLCVRQVASCLSATHRLAVFGAGRYDATVGIATGVNAASAAASVVLVLSGHGIASLGVTTACASIASSLLFWFASGRVLPVRRPCLAFASIQVAREIVTNGARFALISLTGVVAYGSDVVVIGALLPAASVATYAVAARLVGFFDELSSRPLGVLLPAYDHADASGDRDRLLRILTRSLSVSMVILLPFVIAMVAFGPRIVEAWVGPGHGSSAAVATVLAAMLWLQRPGAAAAIALNATERNRIVALVLVPAALANLALSVILTRAMGPIGVALGSLAVVIVSDFAFLPAFACREFGFDYRQYVRESLRPLAAPALAGIVVGLLLHAMALPPGRLVTAAQAAGVFGATWGAWLLWGVGRSARRRYSARMLHTLGWRVTERLTPDGTGARRASAAGEQST